MASEAPVVVRGFFELADAGDYDRLLDTLDPEVVWFGTRGGLDEDQVVRGPEAVIGYLREVREPWQRLSYEVERVIEAGDAVVVFTRERGQPRRGGPELQNDTAAVIKVRDGKIVEMTGYLDRGEALQAARGKDYEEPP